MLVKYLTIDTFTSVNVMDLSIGKWITHLRISPPISVTINCIIHMKDVEAEITPKDAVKAIAASTGCGGQSTHGKSPKRKQEMGSGSDVIDLTRQDEPGLAKKLRTENSMIELDSPLRYRSSNNNITVIGAVPTRLSSFPARTVQEMVSRIEWIATNDEPATTAARYARVFSCDFKGPTYYKHQGVWRWLKDHGRLSNLAGTDLWSPLATSTTKLMKEEKGGSSQGSKQD